MSLQKIQNRLVKIEQSGEKRIYLFCESPNVRDVCRFLFEDLALRFITATGIDTGGSFEVLYHFASDETGCIVTLKAAVRDIEKPSVESVAPVIAGADWAEREIQEVLGIEFKNHPDMRRLVLDEHWPQGLYPLRKVRSETIGGLQMSSKVRKTILAAGPFNPMQEQMECFRLTVEGEKVTGVDVNLSYNHRGVEKISETLEFDQVPYLAGRICGICSASHPLAYANAVEQLAGVSVPERAKFIRVIISEIERISSHLMWAGLMGHYTGYDTVFMRVWKYREPVLEVLEELTGSRSIYDSVCIGGSRIDIPDEHIPGILKRLDTVESNAGQLAKTFLEDPVMRLRLKGIGVLKKEDAVKYSVVGPVARASDIKIDVRHDDSYAAYNALEWNGVSRSEGDIFARTEVRLLEISESISMVKQALAKLPIGPVAAEVKKIPAGESCGRVEAPRGEVFHYVRSDGSGKPVRHKIRPPGFMNVPSFKAFCIGENISDVLLALASLDPCYSCAARIAVAGSRSEVIHDYDALLRMSREKTVRLKKEIGSSEPKMEGL